MALHLGKKEIILSILVPTMIAGIGLIPWFAGKGETNKRGSVSPSLIVESKEGNQIGNATAARDATVINNFPDTSRNKGDTYIVTSRDQKGGITAGKVIINKNVTIVKSDDVVGKHVENNFRVVLDTLNRIIYFQPKIGIWNNPFIGIPMEESAVVQPHFMNQSKKLTLAVKPIRFQGDSLYSMLAYGDPATKDFYYSMHYDNLPSYLLFGSFSSAVYKATFK